MAMTDLDEIMKRAQEARETGNEQEMLKAIQELDGLGLEIDDHSTSEEYLLPRRKINDNRFDEYAGNFSW